MRRHGNQPDLRSRPSPRPARLAATLHTAVSACWFAVTLLTGEWTGIQAVEDSEHPRPVQPVRSSAPSTPDRYVKGEILVRFKDGPFGLAAAEIHRQIGSWVIRSFPHIGWQHVRLPTGMTVSEAVLAYLEFPGVRAAEPNGYLIPAEGRHLVPDDPRLVEQWGLTRICPGVAWGLSSGSPDIVVATIDSGVNYDHQDLAANMWRNPGEIGLDAGGMDKQSNGIDDDANGYVDDVYGIDPCENDSDPWDDWDHGTCIAGILGAVGGNGIGICGVSWQTRIMSLKVYGPDSSGYAVSSVIECYEYVIAMKERGINIRLINNSYGSDYQQSLRDAIDTAGALGILSICAAGNSGQDIDVEPTYPASYDSPFVVSVTSTRLEEPSAEEVHDPSTNWGKNSVDLAAPGTEILSTGARGLAYVEVSGTSFATPHVTGAAALLWSIDPAASPSTIKSLLLNSIDVLPSLEGRVVSGGRLNLGRSALDLIAPDAPSAVLAFLPSGSGTAVDSVATLVFSKPMDRASVESGFSVSQNSPGSFAWSNLDRTVTFRPDAAWHYSGVLTFRLPGNVRDINGEAIGRQRQPGERRKPDGRLRMDIHFSASNHSFLGT
jgi:subtilisin family serine protease